MKKLGFGMMRLPLLENGEVDLQTTCSMVDAYLKAGFTYFDTAHGYLGGRSERAVKSCLTSRYPRDRYILTDKLTAPLFETAEDVRPMIETELEACGVDYFDYVLLHAMDEEYYEKHTRCRSFETLEALRQEGKLRHIGMSFHDTPQVLDRILTEHPELEVVQIQYNYLDVENPKVESQGCYEVCRRHQKPVLIMEPVKGGGLANLPPAAARLLEPLGGSQASYALRYAASREGVLAVLSGMSTPAQMAENLRIFEQFTPLTGEEEAVLTQVRQVILQQDTVACTDCQYCMAGCPMEIPIPRIFKMYNSRKTYLDTCWGYARLEHKASDCIGCGQCESVCPQKLEIRSLLQEAKAMFEP